MNDLTQGEKDKIVFVADKFEEIRKTFSDGKPAGFPAKKTSDEVFFEGFSAEKSSKEKGELKEKKL